MKTFATLALLAVIGLCIMIFIVYLANEAGMAIARVLGGF